MENIDNKYYESFEGEPEIRLISLLKNGELQIFSIWSGYFDEIMDKIEPDSNGWSGLAYYYHMQEGWYENSPWLISDIGNAIKQFNEIREDELGLIAKEVLNQIIDILEYAEKNSNEVQIAYS